MKYEPDRVTCLIELSVYLSVCENRLFDAWSAPCDVSRDPAMQHDSLLILCLIYPILDVMINVELDDDIMRVI